MTLEQVGDSLEAAKVDEAACISILNAQGILREDGQGRTWPAGIPRLAPH